MEVAFPFLAFPCLTFPYLFLFVIFGPLNYLAIYCHLHLAHFHSLPTLTLLPVPGRKNLPAEENREPEKKGLERENSNPFP